MIEADDSEDSAPRRPTKSESAFRTISEVSEELDIPQHVLRFWESKFPHIKPLKRGGGRRYYRPEDVQLLKRIRDLLYKDGYTIRGVQKLLREQTKTSASAEPKPAPAEAPAEMPVEPRADPAPAPHSAAFQPDLLDEPRTHCELDEAPRAELAELLHELEELREYLAAALIGD